MLTTKSVHAIAVSFAGLLAFMNASSEGPKVAPERICPSEEISIIEPTGLNLSLAVRTPDGFHLILADRGIATVVPNYWFTHSVSLLARDLIGFDYNEDGPYVRPVFKVPGIYEFYFAENLETEPENTISFTRRVEFMNDSRACKPGPSGTGKE